jgi:hypothetical protein
MPGRARCPADAIVRRCAQVAQASSELTALAVDAARIVVRTSDGVSLITPTGRHLRDLPIPNVRAAALSGGRLAVRVRGAVDVYDVGSAQMVEHIPVSPLARLEDLEAGISRHRSQENDQAPPACRRPRCDDPHSRCRTRATRSRRSVRRRRASHHLYANGRPLATTGRGNLGAVTVVVPLAVSAESQTFREIRF